MIAAWEDSDESNSENDGSNNEVVNLCLIAFGDAEEVMVGRYNLRSAKLNGTGKETTANTAAVEAATTGVTNTVEVNVGEMMAQLLQVVQNNNQGHQGDPFAMRNKDFGSLGGQKFSGNRKPTAVNAWVQKCEMVFGRMQLTEVQKQELATYQLQGAALFWWNSWKEGLDLTTLTWADFKTRFDLKFIPAAIWSQLSDEFLKLTQEGRTMIEYVTKFNELSRYAPYLVDTQEKKNEKFIKGLNHYLSKSRIPFDVEPFDRVLDLALKYEENEKQFKKWKARVGETSRGSHYRGQQFQRPQQ
ncbi:uncharacterized protein LOC114304472 [Camellia sinensis]|uniref:uncharacterized protein LOC114304472 n=1 Tax=Camellia sinensis TaxID=4442 RepID=UPI001035FC4F|nr:uncharacterized protein LOC114304472 [Camellia sinensis]